MIRIHDDNHDNNHDDKNNNNANNNYNIHMFIWPEYTLDPAPKIWPAQLHLTLTGSVQLLYEALTINDSILASHALFPIAVPNKSVAFGYHKLHLTMITSLYGDDFHISCLLLRDSSVPLKGRVIRGLILFHISLNNLQCFSGDLGIHDFKCYSYMTGLVFV